MASSTPVKVQEASKKKPIQKKKSEPKPPVKIVIDKNRLAGARKSSRIAKMRANKI